MNKLKTIQLRTNYAAIVLPEIEIDKFEMKIFYKIRKILIQCKFIKSKLIYKKVLLYMFKSNDYCFGFNNVNSYRIKKLEFVRKFFGEIFS